jgi:O-6-methylguanine DNA methyltransferase
VALLRRHPGAVEVRPGNGDLLADAVAAVDDPTARHDLPLDLRGTPFQLAVWYELRRIPAGSVISYAELARRVGRPRAYRAVAQACGANPVGVLVPCHRVIASDGSLGGFGFGLTRKAGLLRREGLGPLTMRDILWSGLPRYPGALVLIRAGRCPARAPAAWCGSRPAGRASSRDTRAAVR